jgi:hypothetical protein
MKLVNGNGQVHMVYVNIETCVVQISRMGHPMVTIRLDPAIGFADGLNKIKRVVSLDDELYDLVSIAPLS